MTFEFRSDDHSYWLDGRRIPGVSEILKAAGLVDTTWYTPESAEWGTRLHLLLQYDDEGTLDETTLDPEYAPYLEAWRRYRADFPFTVMEIEKPLYASSCPQFAGTPDRIIQPQGFSRHEVLDIKTGEPKAPDVVQVCAYAMLLGSGDIAAPRIVYVNPALPIPYLHQRVTLLDVMMESAIFQNALHLWHWRNQHSLL